jgi:putative endonuclease
LLEEKQIVVIASVAWQSIILLKEGKTCQTNQKNFYSKLEKLKMSYYIYFVTNNSNSVIYTGVTNDLVRRVWEHKQGIDKKSFSSKYKTNKLVYYEVTDSIESAILREKQLKAGARSKKVELINSFNPTWEDLYLKIV